MQKGMSLRAVPNTCVLAMLRVLSFPLCAPPLLAL